MAKIVNGVVVGLDPNRPLTPEERELVREAQRWCNEDFFRRSKAEWAEMGGLPIPPMPGKPETPPERPAEPALARNLKRIRDRALLLGCDPDTVDRALMNYLASFDPIRRSREPGEDDE